MRVSIAGNNRAAIRRVSPSLLPWQRDEYVVYTARVRVHRIAVRCEWNAGHGSRPGVHRMSCMAATCVARRSTDKIMTSELGSIHWVHAQSMTSVLVLVHWVHDDVSIRFCIHWVQAYSMAYTPVLVSIHCAQ